MLDGLPREILFRIAYYIDPDAKKRHPDYCFYYPSKQLRSLSQVNHYLQDAIAPLLYSHTSLLRKLEYEGIMPYSYERAATRLKHATVYQKYIHELEMPSSMAISEVQNFKHIKSLTLLGDNDFRFDTHLQLQHIALVLPQHKFQIEGLRRLDLVIDPRLIKDMNALESFKKCSIEELNVTVRDLVTIVKYKPFLLFLLSLKSLKKFSIRCSNQPQPSSLNISPSDIYSTTTQFFQVLNKLPLTHLSFDFLLLRIHSTIQSVSSSIISRGKPLNIDIIEPTLAGPLTKEQSSDILTFLSQLSTYNIHTLNLVFGIQTELPYNTALHVLQTLSLEIHHGEEQFQSLRSIKNVGALMAWHIIDDSVYMDYGISRGLHSYESDGNFTPGYRVLERYEVKVSENSLYLVRKGQEVAYDFWSRECVSTLLLKFSKYKRSSLWD